MTVRKVPIDIELTGALILGMTITDFRFPSPADCYTRVALKLDETAFWDLFVDALEGIGEVEKWGMAGIIGDIAGRDPDNSIESMPLDRLMQADLVPVKHYPSEFYCSQV
ncbi:Uncharacterised protein [Serratia fonticola]|uniref:Uncharacterized protein n=1 Tax=Serratia fonticola TaxID=47917 RepID=A0A4U9WAA6_SERFO|nr:Uncharacterised protein [Serratia fonticola]